MKVDEFGKRLKYLRLKNGLEYNDVIEKMEIRNITKYDIKNWERGLAHPPEHIMRKLSEIYDEPYEELLVLHEQTIQAGIENVHMGIINVISKWMGVSMYTVIWLLRIMLVLVCIIGVLLFIQSMNKFVEFAEKWK